MSVNPTLIKKAKGFLSVLPHCNELGLSIDQVTDTTLVMVLPYTPKIIGNPLSGVIHGGSLTTLVDTACGTACYTFLPANELCPTLDLRIEHMQPSEPEADLYAEAEVVRITASVVFTRCNVYQFPPDHERRKLVSSCTATFIRLQPDKVRGQSISSKVSSGRAGE